MAAAVGDALDHGGGGLCGDGGGRGRKNDKERVSEQMTVLVCFSSLGVPPFSAQGTPSPHMIAHAETKSFTQIKQHQTKNKSNTHTPSQLIPHASSSAPVILDSTHAADSGYCEMDIHLST